jgi:hypothetical protein
MSCASTPKKNYSVSLQINDHSQNYFQQLAKQGTVARAYYTLFIPETSINKRHMLEFRRILENSIRRFDQQSNVNFNSSADKVFFLSKHNIDGWNPPSGDSEATLANEFFCGSDAGWKIFNTYWSQLNRLLIGDANWIQKLPNSIRSDLSNPTTYILRVSVVLDNNPSLTEYIHSIQYDFVEVGTEKVIFSRSYPLITNYQLP